MRIENNILKINNIEKKYGNKSVIRNISFEINNNDIVGLLGPNGAGKTTLFYIIVGLIKANVGNILLNDDDITKYPIQERSKLGIAYLPQESSIFRGMNVEDNISAILEIIEKDKKKRKEKLERLLEELSIAHLRKSSALVLSGGERRRVEIARTLASNPKFILLDEPFAGIDPIAVNDIMSIIKKLKQQNIGVLITDHNFRETLAIVDRAYIIYDGDILTSGSRDEILSNNDVKRVYLGENMIR